MFTVGPAVSITFLLGRSNGAMKWLVCFCLCLSVQPISCAPTWISLTSNQNCWKKPISFDYYFSSRVVHFPITSQWRSVCVNKQCFMCHPPALFTTFTPLICLMNLSLIHSLIFNWFAMYEKCQERRGVSLCYPTVFQTNKLSFLGAANRPSFVSLLQISVSALSSSIC